MPHVERKPLFLPRWLEAIVVVVLFVMCIVEFRHGQFFWSFLFGAAAIGFGIGLLARIFKGDPNGPT